MFISEEGNVVGSVNRAELAAAYEQATDEAVRANLAAVGAEHGMHVEDGKLVDPSVPLLTDAELTAQAEVEAEAAAAEDAEVEAEGEVDEPEAPSRPNVNASKADWVDWAVSQGADYDEADADTKANLIELYGG